MLPSAAAQAKWLVVARTRRRVVHIPECYQVTFTSRPKSSCSRERQGWLRLERHCELAAGAFMEQIPDCEYSDHMPRNRQAVITSGMDASQMSSRPYNLAHGDAGSGDRPSHLVKIGFFRTMDMSRTQFCMD